MARFDDFKQQERRVIREAMIGAQSEFYDPGHTKEERDTLEALIREIEDRDLPFTFGEEPAVPASKRYRNLSREERQREAERLAAIGDLMPIIRQTAAMVGFEIVNRITFRDKATGREYR